MKNLFYAFMLIFFSLSTNAVIRYVTTAGAGLQNGNSWANAYPTNSLQIAINNSSSGDEVWVEGGIYYTTTTTNRAISFNMKNGVAIYGSFIGNETALSQRSIIAGPTSTLSAEIGTFGNADNSYHTIYNTALNNSAIIDGFVIRDANDNRPATTTDGLGGGIYNNGSNTGNICSPTIRNCVITNNSAVFGAGIFNSGYLGGVSNPQIINCVITTNTATGGGGGIDNFGLAGTSSPTITNCIFYSNVATQRAGGMYCWGGNNGNASPTVINSVFVNNSAIDGGGVVYDRSNSSSGNSGTVTPTFKNCIFWGNTASGTAPQFFNIGSASFIATYSTIDLTGQTTPHVISGTGNINLNPVFTNIINGAGTDGKWMTNDDGLQLQPTSPCINSGDNIGVPLTDMLFNPRIANTIVDIGAYEYIITTLIQTQNFNQNEIMIFPNPTKNIFSIMGFTSNYYKIEVINNLGIDVLNLVTTTNDVDISNLRNGVYTIIIESDDKIIIKKLIKD